MNLVIYIITAIAIAIFLIYSSLAIHHASKFRHLSKRTVKLTWFYIISSSILLILLIIAIFFVDLE